MFRVLWILLLQVWEGKHTDDKKERANGEVKPQNSFEAASNLIEEPIPSETKEEPKLLENGSVAETRDAPKSANPVMVSEKRILPNGVANGC